MIFVNAALPAALPRAADPARAALGLERWLEAGRAADPATAGFAADLAADPRGRALLEAVLGNSPHLTESLLREPAFLRRIAEDGLDAAFEWTLAQMEAAGREAADMPPLMAALRHGKRRGALAIALADIAGQWPLMRITGALSRLAEAALQPAAALLLRQAAAAGRIELPDPADAAAGSGLIVLGMGKLGARELNYSSDIDLIVFYDDGRIRTKRPDDLRQTFVRIARDLVRLMDERTGDGYVFRTDLRLRPDPAATPLAVSVTAAEQYYGSLGQNWERAAMIKARPVAGDPQAGAELLKILRPFVWRRNLDFYAIQDIHSIKRQIHAHRGGERPAVNGHNIKLGRGGIREIEFYAQTQQLIHGGRDPRLRVAGTLEALQLLVDTGRIAQGVADDLSRAYGYLRRLEHRLQMVDDRQTHSLPESDEAVAAIGTFMGHADTDEFRRTLMETLELVEGHYARLFEEHETLSGPGNLVFTGKMDDPQTLETLKGLGFQEPGRVAAAIRAWHFGRYRATRSTRARELLTELTPALLAALGGTPQPDHAFTKFDDFLSRLPAGVQLFSLFQANPDLLALVAEIMGTAPRLAERLAQTPELFDAMLTPGYFGPLPGRDALAAELDLLLSTARDFEDVLSLTRRWTTDHRFQVGVQLLRHRAQADAAAPFLSDVAELVLGALLPHVEAEFARRHGRVPGGGMAVAALGKLGSREVSIRSDLDLILVYDAPPDAVSDGSKPLMASEYFIKLSHRLIAAISAPMGDGSLYEIDMRLRPSGSKGPLAVSLEGFARYLTDAAWTWERMAMTRARAVAGPPALCAALEAAIRAELTRPRDADALLRDVAQMRAMMAKEFATGSIWDVKHMPGGLVDIEFIAQYLQLRHGPDDPGLLAQGTIESLTRLAERGLLPLRAAAELIDGFRLWQRVQGFQRMATERGFDPASAPQALLAAMARAAFPDRKDIDFAQAELKIREVAGRVHAWYDRIVAEPAAALPPRPQSQSQESTGP